MKFSGETIFCVRQFAENELWPIAGKIDKSGEYPAQQIHKMGELGLMAIGQIYVYDGKNPVGVGPDPYSEYESGSTLIKDMINKRHKV